MNAREKGFLLLTSHLGDPQQKVLTIPQLRMLAKCVTSSRLGEKAGDVTAEDIMELGYDCAFAQRIIDLFSREAQLQWYLQKAARYGCAPITRISEAYPDRLRKYLGTDAPGVLWAKGDSDILRLPSVALVGSRDLHDENLVFAREVGKQAALQGFALVSGNARGADRAAQDSCLAHGGSVISVVADALQAHAVRENILYLSEDGFDLPFSSRRALLRNRVIHSLAPKTFVAQCTFEKGGTWQGTKGNLRFGWSDVFCFDDGSKTSRELEQMGATLITAAALTDIAALQSQNIKFIDQ